jgi:hypothetical protein
MGEMPEGMPQFFFGGPPEPHFTPEEQAQIEAWEQAQMHMQVTERKQMIRFSAVFCTCRPWPERGNADPPQAGCRIHTAVSWDPFTETWFW